MAFPKGRVVFTGFGWKEDANLLSVRTKDEEITFVMPDDDEINDTFIRIERLMIYSRWFVPVHYYEFEVDMSKCSDELIALEDWLEYTRAMVHQLLPRVDSFNNKIYDGFMIGQTVVICTRKGLYVTKPDYPDYAAMKAILRFISLGCVTLSGGGALAAMPTSFSLGEYMSEVASEVEPPSIDYDKGLMKVCFNCRKCSKTFQRCSICHIARYCNSQCQKEDWKLHKHACYKAKGSTDATATTILRYVESLLSLSRRPEIPKDERDALFYSVLNVGPIRKPAEFFSVAKLLMRLLRKYNTDDVLGDLEKIYRCARICFAAQP